MLEFNCEHKSINTSLNNRKNNFKIKNFILGGVLVASVILFSGCSKIIECNINDNHAHRYVNELSFDKYMQSEKEEHGEWDYTEDYIIIDDDMEKLLKFEKENQLFKISDNKDIINKITSSHNDHIEYRYEYSYKKRGTGLGFIGKTPVSAPRSKKKIGHTWTTDTENKELTGEQRVVHYMYYGYKIEELENGKMILLKSELVDNLEDLPNDYLYIKEDFYIKVDVNDKTKQIDYEDGPEEIKNKPIIEQEKYKKEQEKYEKEQEKYEKLLEKYEEELEQIKNR